MLDSKALAVKNTDLIRSFAQNAGLALPDDHFIKPEFVGADFQSLWLKEFDEQTYHSDLTAVARGDIVAAQKSAAHFKSRRQQLEMEESEPLRFGRLIHMLVLEPEKLKRQFVLMPDFGDMRSSKNRDTRDAWKASLDPSATICTQQDMVKLFCMAKSIMQNETACDLLFGAEFEMTGFYRDPVTGLKCRFRADAWNRDIGALIDLKSTQDASESEFMYSAWKYRYDIQLAKYSFGVEQLFSKPETNALIVVESKAPWTCSVKIATKEFMARGLKDHRRGMDTIAEAITTNTYPSSSQPVCELALPRKAQYE